MQDQIKPKLERLILLDTTLEQLDNVREALEGEEGVGSLNPVVAARATAQLVKLRNTQEDLRVIRALLAGTEAAALSAIPVAAVQELDELAAMLDKQTKASAIANASLVFLGQAITAANRVGQILDERPKPPAGAVRV